MNHSNATLKSFHIHNYSRSYILLCQLLIYSSLKTILYTHFHKTSFSLRAHINTDNSLFVGVIVWVVGVMNELFLCAPAILAVLFAESGTFSLVLKRADSVCSISTTSEHDFHRIKIVRFPEDDLRLVIMDIGRHDESQDQATWFN